MLLNDIFTANSIRLNLTGATKEAVFAELVDAIVTAHPGCDHAEMLTAIHDRENKMSTGIVSGVAIPHGYCRGMNIVTGALGISQTGIAYDSLDQQPVYVVFMIILGETARENHLRLLNQIFTLVNSDISTLLRKARSVQEIQDILKGL